MSFEGLHISRSGVAASQRALEVIGHNIANVSTPGHTRQRVEQVSTERIGPSLVLGPGANGTGVTVEGVTRVREFVLDVNVRSELASAGGADIDVQTLSEIERALGPYEDGLGESLTAFFNAWEELSLDPTSTTARSQVLDAAEALSHGVRTAATEVAAVQTANTSTAQTMLEEQNAAFAEVARLNGEIRAQQAVGENPNGLLDERDRLLDTLATTVGAKVHLHDDGMVNVSVGGYEVVRGTNHTPLVIGGVPAVFQSPEGTTIAAGGQLGALVVGGGAKVAEVVADLDALAVAIRDQVNTAHALGFDLFGVAGTDLFSGTDAESFVVSSGFTTDLLAASSAGSANDGNHAIAMAGLRSQSGVDGTLHEQARAVIGGVGSAVLTARTSAESTQGVLAALEATRAAVSGVNLDEELTMLLQYQRAYEASARVMTSIDEMLDVLINRTGLVGR